MFHQPVLAILVTQAEDFVVQITAGTTEYQDGRMNRHTLNY